MDELMQRALSDEIRAELARRDLTAKSAQEAIGLSSTAWQTYFKRMSRDVPMRVLIDLAHYLDMPLSQLIRQAEARAADIATHEDRAEAALRRASPSAQRRARKLAREVRSQPEEDASADQTGNPGVVRSASTGR